VTSSVLYVDGEVAHPSSSLDDEAAHCEDGGDHDAGQGPDPYGWTFLRRCRHRSEGAGMDGSLRVELFVADVQGSAHFYCSVLGFEVMAAEAGSSGDYLAVRRGQATIGLGRADRLPADHPVARVAGTAPGRGVELVLEVADLDAAYERARAVGPAVTSELARRPWGLRDFRVTDPDGFYVRITSAG
jgi:lactoylglutathione lyase